MNRALTMNKPDQLTVADVAVPDDKKSTFRLQMKPGPVLVDTWPARAARPGTPILLIHGWGGSGSYWRDTAEHLSSEATVIVPDLPGTGRSQPVKQTQDMFEQVDTLRRVVDALSAEKIQIVGHSMGAAMALLLNDLIPERVERLVLTSMCFFMTAKQAEIYESIMKFVRLTMRIRWKEMVDIPGLSYLMAQRYFYRVPRDRAILRQGFLDYLTLDYDTASACAANATDPRIEAAGTRVKVPTLLIACRQDQVMPVENVNYSVDKIPGCELRWIEECGHLPMVEKAEEYRAILREFLWQK